MAAEGNLDVTSYSFAKLSRKVFSRGYTRKRSFRDAISASFNEKVKGNYDFLFVLSPSWTSYCHTLSHDMLYVNKTRIT